MSMDWFYSINNGRNTVTLLLIQSPLTMTDFDVVNMAGRFYKRKDLYHSVNPGQKLSYVAEASCHAIFKVTMNHQTLYQFWL